MGDRDGFVTSMTEGAHRKSRVDNRIARVSSPTLRSSAERSDDFVGNDVDHLAFTLQLAAAGEHVADSTSRRCSSNTDGHRIRLAWPVSSSIVTNNTPRALPGRCRTRTMPATSTRLPSWIAPRSAQRMIRRCQIVAQETDRMAAQAEPANDNPPPPGGLVIATRSTSGSASGSAGTVIEQRQPAVRQAADRPQRLAPVEAQRLERIGFGESLQCRDRQVDATIQILDGCVTLAARIDQRPASLADSPFDHAQAETDSVLLYQAVLQACNPSPRR